MTKYKISGEPLKNIPWQERPENNQICWRYSENPVIGRNPAPEIARTFNSAVIPYEGKFIGVFRSENTNGVPHLFLGRSDDAIKWEFDPKKIEFTDEDGNPWDPSYSYDPRLIKIEDTYYIVWCTDFHGASLGLAKTTDFKTFTRLENPFIPFNRNGVLFPEKINGNFMLLSRPSDSGHTPFGDIFLSESPDLVYWGKHRRVMAAGNGWWQWVKIGAGPVPIKTDDGWLLIYHGVSGTCNGYVYSMGAAILDLENPSIVKHRCSNLILTPEEWYEERGFVPNVVFPCAALCDADTGRLAIYYGAADSYVGLAFSTVDILMDYIKANDNAGENEHSLGK